MFDSMFGYRLLFLMLFMVSLVTWVFFWLVGYVRYHPLIHSHPGNSGALSATGITLVLLCAILDFLQLIGQHAVLLMLACLGLAIPWGMVLLVKCQEWMRNRKCSTHN
ncbi:hypothetical protein ACM79J_31230 [Pseudomonas aeruginosa]|jgi:hypothetical protein|uniref:Uncharacterized protein n=1 Tax=Pseudomonas putida TaxID=303 RepID=A0A2S3WZJ1_PSEPU|nr:MULTISPECIES: hypothetical protein [Pseudomonas]MDD2015958.1 hypothetical protein [Pseudomonas putida]POG06847.1 hypothetical protein BGP82_09655 [Pseudomonas putida]HDS1771299.1 hypothetical protein [Pseudomonas putida]